MGIGVVLQRMWKHNDGYRERLQTMLRGMISQGLGTASGAHSSFIPYHVDAITLQAVGQGWQDDMALGRCVESTFRSLNNLLEHFHQSFFFYLLMQANRFVSIGTYLPSAMLVSVSFSIMAIGLWVRSGRADVTAEKVASPEDTAVKKEPQMEVVKKDGMTAVVPTQAMAIVERHLFLPITLVTAAHFLGVLPLYLFNNTKREVSRPFTVECKRTDNFLGTANITASHSCGQRYATTIIGEWCSIYDSYKTACGALTLLLALAFGDVSGHSSNIEFLAVLPGWPSCHAAIIRWAHLPVTISECCWHVFEQIFGIENAGCHNVR